MYYVYLLQSRKFFRVYIGSTGDLRKRFYEHNHGKVTSTKAYAPYNLIYYEAYVSRFDARKREIELKTKSQQKEALLKRIENSLKMLL
jgi:putative endonuclease